MSRSASRPGVRSARSGPKSVSGNTVEARGTAGGRLGATRRAALSRRQGSSRHLPDVPASRCAPFLPCRRDSAAQTMTLVRIPGWPAAPALIKRCPRPALFAAGCAATVPLDPTPETVEAAHHERTRRRPGGTIRNRARCRGKVFLVRLRPERHPALLRRLAQGHRHPPDRLYRRGKRDCVALRAASRPGASRTADGTHNTL